LDGLADRATDLRNRDRLAINGRDRVHNDLLIVLQFVGAGLALEGPVDVGIGVLVRQLDDSQVPALCDIEDGGRDVDRIDPLVDQGADLARTHLLDQLETLLTSSDGFETADRDGAATLRVGALGTVQRKQRGAAEHQRGQSRRQRQTLGGEGAVQRPMLGQHLIGRNGRSRHREGQDDDLTRAAWAVGELRVDRVESAGRVGRARRGRSRRTRCAIDVVGVGVRRKGDLTADLLDPHVQPLQHPPGDLGEIGSVGNRRQRDCGTHHGVADLYRIVARLGRVDADHQVIAVGTDRRRQVAAPSGDGDVVDLVVELCVVQLRTRRGQPLFQIGGARAVEGDRLGDRQRPVRGHFTTDNIAFCHIVRPSGRYQSQCAE